MDNGDGTSTPRMIRLSASQFNSWFGCKRAWYYETVQKHREPNKPSFEYGEKLHKQIEQYFKGGDIPEDARAAQSLRNLPTRGDGLDIEGKIDLLIDATHTMVGRKDLVDWRDPTHPVLYDHKTSADPEKNGKTEYELAGDIQLNIYARALLAERTLADRVTITHNIIASKGKIRSMCPSVTLTSEQVDKVWSKIVAEIPEMDRVRELPHAGQVEANGHKTGHCEKYHGCYHRSICDRDSVVTIGRGGRNGFGPREKTERNGMVSENLQAKLKNLGKAIVPNTNGTHALGKMAPPPTVVAVSPLAKAKAEAAAAKEAERIAEEAEAAQATEAEVEADSETTDTSVASGPTGGPSTLLIDCVPMAGLAGAVALEVWIAPLLAGIAEVSGGEHWQAIDYRKGCAMVLQGIEQNATELPAVLLVDSESYIGKTALEGLMTLYPTIIRGR